MRRLLVLSLFACGGTPAPAPAPTGPPASFEPPPADPGDLQVATVNGRPVWGSCVAAQASRGIGKREALDECIAFELMAQEAEARELALDPEVVLATRTALVSELVAQEFEDKYNTPAEIGDYWNRSLARNRARLEHPEARGSVYARIPVAKDATPAEDAQARTLANELAAALAAERGLMEPHLKEIAERVIDGRAKLDLARVPPDIRHGRLHEAYTSALFAIPEVGRTSPAVRTPWGWDVVLWETVIPEAKPTPEELVKAALPEIKRGFFTQWVNRIATSLGVKIQIVDQNLPLLEEL